MSELPPTSSGLSAALPQGVRRVLAVAGGRPGVGHSIIALNLAVYLAQLGRKVVLVDSDGTGAAAHAMLGLPLPAPTETPELFEEEELELLATPVPGLSLLPQRYGQASTTPLRPGRKPRWAKALRQLDADYVLLDLGPGTAPATLDLFLGADAGLCITAPDPPSVEATYRFLRAAFLRRVRRMLVRDRFKMRQLELALNGLPPLPGPVELVRAIARYDRGTAASAARELSLLHPYLITNHTRLRQDVELGRAMVDLSARYLGIHAEDLGHIEHDDAIWLSVVRKQPLLIENPTSKGARNLERIARRVVAIATSRPPNPAPELSLEEEEHSLYDVLWTHRGASDEELRRAYKRQRDVFSEGSLPLWSLLSETDRARARGSVEEAQETLLDPVRRRAYDISFFPREGDAEREARPERSSAQLAEQEMLREELAHEIHSETEFTGELLRRVRESRGIELEEIAQKTKISGAHLRAIEAEEFSSLPAEVYTRGFVQQVSQLLGVDATQATRTYLRRYRRARRAAAQDPGSQT